MGRPWENYKNQSFYVSDISWKDVMEKACDLCSMALAQWEECHSGINA